MTPYSAGNGAPVRYFTLTLLGGASGLERIRGPPPMGLVSI